MTALADGGGMSFKPTKEDLARFRGQKRTILSMLAERPRTNRELSAVALKYTGRLSELKDAGFVIACTDLRGGETLYELKGKLLAPPAKVEPVVDEKGQAELFRPGQDRSGW